MFRVTTIFVPAGFRSDGRRLDDGAGLEALLLAALPELSAKDRASGLQASRRSPSQATQILVQAVPIEHRRRLGERLFPGEAGRLGRDDPAEGNPWSADPLDPNPDAIHCNSDQSREQKILYLCGTCKSLQSSATTDRTLVAGAGVSGSSPLVGSLIPHRYTE